jgi:hypothetical protein
MPAPERTARVGLADRLIAEVQAADVLVLGTDSESTALQAAQRQINNALVA